MVSVVKKIANLVLPDPAAVLARLNQRIAEAKAAAEEADAEFNEASLAVEMGEPDSADRKKHALKARDAALRAVLDIEAAIAAATLRQQEAEREAKIADWHQKWDAVATHADARGKLAGEIEAVAAQLGDLLSRFDNENRQMVEAAPIEVEGHGAVSDTPVVTGEVRCFLKRCGVLWAWQGTQWDAEHRPTFVERISSGNEYLLAKRHQLK